MIIDKTRKIVWPLESSDELIIWKKNVKVNSNWYIWISTDVLCLTFYYFGTLLVIFNCLILLLKPERHYPIYLQNTFITVKGKRNFLPDMGMNCDIHLLFPSQANFVFKVNFL